MLKFLLGSIFVVVISFFLMYLLVIKLTKKEKRNSMHAVLKVIIEILFINTWFLELFDATDKDSVKLKGNVFLKNLKQISIVAVSYILMLIFILGFLGTIYYIKEIF